MRNIIRLLAGTASVILALTACGKNPETEQFKIEIDNFCTNISNIDTAINNVDVTSETAVTEILGYLEELDDEFQRFSELDFPEEYDYLETLADEASNYMKEAVSSYADAYTNENYDEEMFTAIYQYARENESRAFRRIQVIITCLHGEDPEDMGLLSN